MLDFGQVVVEDYLCVVHNNVFGSESMHFDKCVPVYLIVTKPCSLLLYVVGFKAPTFERFQP